MALKKIAGHVCSTGSFRTKGIFFILLWLIVHASAQGVGQQKTLYVNNGIGSDEYDGLAPVVSGVRTGPRRTISSAIESASSGDVIVIAATGLAYGPNTGELPIVQTGAKHISLRAIDGVIEILSGLEINNSLPPREHTVLFDGEGFRLRGGLWLTRGELRSLANLFTVSNSITRAGGTCVGRIRYDGDVDFYYNNLRRPVTLGDEFPPADDTISCRNLMVGGLYGLIADRNITAHGELFIRAPFDLGSNTLVLRNQQGQHAVHTIVQSITNGRITFRLGDSIHVAAPSAALPRLEATSLSSTSRASVRIVAAAVGHINALGSASLDIKLSGVSSATVPEVQGAIRNSGSGTVTIGREVEGITYVSGEIRNEGVGSIVFANRMARGIVINGDVVLASTLTMRAGITNRGQAQIRFGDMPTTITGAIRNNVRIEGTATAAGNDDNGSIVFEALNSGIYLGDVFNAAYLSFDLPPLSVATAMGNGTIRFAFNGSSGGAFVSRSLVNTAVLSGGHTHSGSFEGNGCIVFDNDVAGAMEIGEVTNLTSFLTPTESRSNGKIDFNGKSVGDITVSKVGTSGGAGGIIRFGGGNLLVRGEMVNSRTQPHADILFGVPTAGKSVTVLGDLTLVGSAQIVFSHLQDGGITVHGSTLCRAGGRMAFPGLTSGMIRLLGGLILDGGFLDLQGLDTDDPENGIGNAAGLIQCGDLELTGGTIDLGEAPRQFEVVGSTCRIGGIASSPEILHGSATALVLRRPSGSVLQSLEIGTLEPYVPGSLRIQDDRMLPVGVAIRGGRLRVQGDVVFSTSSTSSVVQLDGAHVVITGVASFVNITGYTTINNGFVSMSGTTQNVGGAGDFGDFEVNVATAVAALAGIGRFTGILYLTAGLFDNTNNITIDNETVTPTIVRDKGTFRQAPIIGTNSMVNLTYVGHDKVSSNELPATVDKLNNVTVATANGGNGAGTITDGKGAPARGVVTLTASPTVNGKLTVNQHQTLAIAQNQAITMKGAEMQIDGQIVNLDAADFTSFQDILILSRAGGTAILGSGLLPPILVVSSGNVIDGPRGIIDRQMGADFTEGAGAFGTDDVIDGDPSAANGTIRFANSTATLTVRMGTGAGAGSTHLGSIATANTGNELTLGGDLMVSNNLHHVAGLIDVATYTLTMRGSAHSITGGARLSGSGLVRFETIRATSLTINAAVATIDANVEVSVGAAGGNLELMSGGQNLVISGNLAVTKASSVGIGAGIQIGDGRTLTAAGSVLTMGAGTAIFASMPPAAATAVLELDAARPPLILKASDDVTIDRLTVSDDVHLALTGAASSVEVTKAFVHSGGELNLDAYDLKITGAYTKLGTSGSYAATTGYLVMNTPVFNHGSIPFSIPNLRFTADATQSLANQTGVVTVTGNLDVQATPDINNANTNNTTILAVGNAATVNYRSGGFDEAPVYDGTITLVVDQAKDGTLLDAEVWPSTPSALVTTLRVANTTPTDMIELPGDRSVNTLELRTGVLDLGTTADRTLTVVDRGTIKRRSSASVVLNGGTLAFGGKEIHVVYEADGAMTTGAELPASVKDLVFTRSYNVPNAQTTINSSVTISALLGVRNSVNIGTSTLVTALGHLKIEVDVAFAKATAPIIGGTGSLALAGSTDQTIVVPSTGSSVGSITIEKASSGSKVTIIGGPLTCERTLTFKRGLVYTEAGSSVVLKENTVGSVSSGFLHNVAAGERSHVVGNVSVPLKSGHITTYGRNEFPVGDANHYRPVSLTFVGISKDLGVSATVRYEDARPIGTIGLPILNGVDQGVHISRYPTFAWYIATKEAPIDGVFNLELTAEGFTDFDDVANIRVIRRPGTISDLTNTWSLHGARYDNYLVDRVPTVVCVGASDGLTPGGAIFAYGLKAKLAIANPIADLVLPDGARSRKISLSSPPVVSGNSGRLTWSARTSDTTFVVVSILGSDTLLVLGKMPTPASSPVTVTVIGTDVDDDQIETSFKVTVTGTTDIEETPIIPTEFSLAQNYPNPFNPSTTIRFGLPKEAPVTLEIYNLLGMKVRTLMTGDRMSAAFYNISWDGKDDSGVSLPSGIYIYRIVADKFVSSKKMTLVK
ncbi:MAG: T9SS type A sorting domain-containing protein [Ignavibacteria bacterium]|nr:T9SS type A sorting domain-containing protein [Ignavibacteria bacterium]